jgi:hypothetical protein
VVGPRVLGGLAEGLHRRDVRLKAFPDGLADVQTLSAIRHRSALPAHAQAVLYRHPEWAQIRRDLEATTTAELVNPVGPTNPDDYPAWHIDRQHP